MRLWELPGPRHYLDRALETMRDGNSLIVAAPAHGASGLAQALESALHVDGWSVAGPILDDGGDPVEQIFGALALDDGGAPRRSVAQLRRLLSPGQVVLVSGVRTSRWPVWKLILAEYELASRGVSSFERPLLVVLTEGVPLKAMPERGAALKVHACEGIIGELDVLLFVIDALRGRGRLDYRSKLISRMVCRLALWDLSLAEFLLEQNAKDLFAPDAVMRVAAEVLGTPTGLEHSWESGGLLRFDGVESLHPFLLLADGDPKGELRMRLWAAQAAEILPALEVHRRNLVHRMRGAVAVPLVVGGERYDDLDDMEIGPLAHIANVQNLGNSIRQAANKLRRLRNSLAHLEALDAIDALDEELLVVRASSRR